MSPLEYLDYPKYEISDFEKEKISHGNSITIKADDGIVILTRNSKIMAVCLVTDGTAKCLKVFI